MGGLQNDTDHATSPQPAGVAGAQRKTHRSPLWGIARRALGGLINELPLHKTELTVRVYAYH